MTERKPVTESPEVLRAMDNIAAVLQQAADRIRKRTLGDVPVSLYDLEPDHGSLARDVAKDVQSCMGNLNLDDLILACTRADRGVR